VRGGKLLPKQNMEDRRSRCCRMAATIGVKLTPGVA
jgi:hypothetical protein